MNQYLSLLLLFLIPSVCVAQGLTVANSRAFSNHEIYIRGHAEIAVSEMYQSGIPSSIKLAQGLLETGAGTSRMATDGNNHFGIKCKSNWMGDTLLVKDDDLDANGVLIESCFRRYASTAESYCDHSEFLQTSPRYGSLFELDRTDYKGWAEGLQRCGYATNPQYADKLVSLIERYQLQVFDRVPEHDITACLDYYDTQLYVAGHQQDQSIVAHHPKPKAVTLPRNYKGGWLRENTRIRMITSILDRGPKQETVQVSSEGGYLSFEVASQPK